MNVHLYRYPRTRKTGPSKLIVPVSAFYILPVYPGAANWEISRDFKNRKRNLLNRDMTANIQGQSFELPVKELEESVWKGARQEEKMRVFGLIEKAGI